MGYVTGASAYSPPQPNWSGMGGGGGYQTPAQVGTGADWRAQQAMGAAPVGGPPVPRSISRAEQIGGGLSPTPMGAGGPTSPGWNWADWQDQAESFANAALGGDKPQLLAGLANAQMQAALGNYGANQNNESIASENAYLNALMGYANQGAGLAHQLLGVDRSDLGISRSDLTIDRADYSRDWGMRQWQMQNELAGRGATVTPGSRFQDNDMWKQLLLADKRFDNQGRRLDNEGRRIDIRGEQIDLNLQEQLAGYEQQLAQNGIELTYDSINDAMQAIGLDQNVIDYILGLAQSDASVAALVAQMLAEGPPGGYRPGTRPTRNPDRG